MFLKSLQISLESTCVGVFFYKVISPQNCNCNFVKSSSQVSSWEFSELFKSTYFVEDLWTAGSETPVLLYKNIFFKEHLQWLLLTVSGSSLQLYSLKETLAKMFICEFCKIFKNFFRQNTSGWLHVWILRSFPDHFFYRAPLGNCSFDPQVPEFQPQDTIQSI